MPHRLSSKTCSRPPTRRENCSGEAWKTPSSGEASCSASASDWSEVNDTARTGELARMRDPASSSGVGEAARDDSASESEGSKKPRSVLGSVLWSRPCVNATISASASARGRGHQ